MADRDVLLDLSAKLVAIHAGHFHVGDHGIGAVAAEHFEGFHAILGGEHLLEVLGKSGLHDLGDGALVVHHQHGVVGLVDDHLAEFLFLLFYDFVDALLPLVEV